MESPELGDRRRDAAAPCRETGGSVFLCGYTSGPSVRLKGYHRAVRVVSARPPGNLELRAEPQWRVLASSQPSAARAHTCAGR